MKRGGAFSVPPGIVRVEGGQFDYGRAIQGVPGPLGAPTPFAADLICRWVELDPFNACAAVHNLESRALDWSVGLNVFNLFDERGSDIDYFYTSRLQGEPAAEVDDIHTHPAEPREFRLSLTHTF